MVVPFQGFLPCIFSQTALGYNELVIITTTKLVNWFMHLASCFGRIILSDANFYRKLYIKIIFPKIKMFWQDHVCEFYKLPSFLFLETRYLY